MIAIIYNERESISFNGQTYYKVEGLYKGNAQPINSFEITESEYNAWLSNLSDFHYINSNNKAINNAVESQSKRYEYTTEKLKETIKVQMKQTWAEAQVLSDLGEDVSILNAEYTQLIDEYKNI